MSMGLGHARPILPGWGGQGLWGQVRVLLQLLNQTGAGDSTRLWAWALVKDLQAHGFMDSRPRTWQGWHSSLCPRPQKQHPVGGRHLEPCVLILG